jgi:hypothetical protein
MAASDTPALRPYIPPFKRPLPGACLPKPPPRPCCLAQSLAQRASNPAVQQQTHPSAAARQTRSHPSLCLTVWHACHDSLPTPCRPRATGSALPSRCVPMDECKRGRTLATVPCVCHALHMLAIQPTNPVQLFAGSLLRPCCAAPPGVQDQRRSCATDYSASLARDTADAHSGALP